MPVQPNKIVINRASDRHSNGMIITVDGVELSARKVEVIDEVGACTVVRVELIGDVTILNAKDPNQIELKV